MNSPELTAKIIHYLESNNQKGNWNWFLAEYQQINQTRQEYQNLFPEMDKREQKILLSEIEELTKQETQLISQIKEQIITEKSSEQEIIMEIRPGAGGVEAGLFARDLYGMYCGFAEKKRWKVETIENKVGEKGNFISVFFAVRGKSVFNCLKNEAGVHRVQRVPTTGHGERHTSTASVVILSKLQDIKLDISEKNLKIETYGSGGPGGQHANKTESAVKVTYTYSTATGKTETITAVSQESREQPKNKKAALLILKKRLWERKQVEQNQKIGNVRSAAIGSAERSEKIRTYNFFGNRVTDHRLKIDWGEPDSILRGNLEEIIQQLIDYEVEKKIS
jgi:peptide chain release factor 1